MQKTVLRWWFVAQLKLLMKSENEWPKKLPAIINFHCEHLSKAPRKRTKNSLQLDFHLAAFVWQQHLLLGIFLKKLLQFFLIQEVKFIFLSGVDLLIDNAVEASGGLHVLCAFLPTTRVEKQVFGRAARNGQAGSGSMILWMRDVKAFLGNKFPSIQTITSFEEIRDIRDKMVEERLCIFERDELPLSMLSGNLFQRMCVTMKAIRETIEQSSIVQTCKCHVQKQCEERWAFWLDKEITRIKRIISDGNGNSRRDARCCNFLSK